MRADSSILISIVVPVYNTEPRYLDRCLSVFRRSFDGVELIVVDDGSDESVREYLTGSLLPTVQTHWSYYEQPNAGVNAARGRGVREARGDYIFFLDSDDFLDEEEFRKTCKLLRDKRPDVLGYNICVVDARGTQVDAWRRCDEPYKRIGGAELMAMGCNLWTQVVRRRFLEGDALVQGCTIGEDLASITPILTKTNNLSMTSCYPYRYVQRASSVTHVFAPDAAFGILDAFASMLERMPSPLGEYQDAVEWLAIQHVLYFGGKRMLKTNGFDKEGKRRIFAFVEERFPSWRTNPYLKRERRVRGADFALITAGHWRLYLLLSGAGHALRTLKAVVAS